MGRITERSGGFGFVPQKELDSLLTQGMIRFTVCIFAATVLLAQNAGKSAEAEQKIDSILREHPDDLGAVMLKAALLDSRQRYKEAEGLYQRAMKLAPNSAQVFNNAANHYLASGDGKRARELYRKTLVIDPRERNASLQLARMSVDDGQGEKALEYLGKSDSGDDPTVAQLRARALELAAAARFKREGPEAALGQLEQTPEAARGVDFYLLRAQLLDAMGRSKEAVASLNQGIRAAPTRPDVYLEATGFLVKHNHLKEAYNLVAQACLILPDERELQLAQAVTLVLLRREPDAQNLLTTMQSRWPEWDRPYLLHGMLLENGAKSAEARPVLEKAIALGANTPEAYYYEALAIMHANPDDLESAQKAIKGALALTSEDPYILVLAGKISIARKEYSQAIRQLLQAERLKPTYIPVHYALRDAYKAMGDVAKSTGELEKIRRLAQANPGEEQNPFSMENFLFGVRPPG